MTDYTSIDIVEMAKLTGLGVPELEALGRSHFIWVHDEGQVSSDGTWAPTGRRMIGLREKDRLTRVKDSPRLMQVALLLGKQYLYEERPELTDYLLFHDIIDVVCWLTKLRYSPKDSIKRRSYRLDVLFDSYLSLTQPELPKLARLKGERHSKERMAFHLNKGWYNELVRSYPLESDALNVGTTIKVSWQSSRSVAWNIAQSYYAVYEYVNSVVYSNTDSLRTEEHRKSTRHFNTTLLQKMSGHLLHYPFNLTNPLLARIEDLRQGDESFWGYQFARYPRNSDKTIFDLESDYVSLLSTDANFLDLLYQFRIWANYTGINTILSLQDGPYLSFLYRNLSLVCFFYGCFAELMALAILGEKETIALLRNIAENYILKQDNFIQNRYLIPPFIRFRFYQKHGLVTSSIDFLSPPSADPILI